MVSLVGGGKDGVWWVVVREEGSKSPPCNHRSTDKKLKVVVSIDKKLGHGEV